MPTLGEVTEAVKSFRGEPQSAQTLASVLGFKPVTAPADILSGPTTPLQRFLESRFGVRELYRAGGIQTDTGSAGIYIAVLDDWGTRSVDRDRARRRVARALVELERDARSLFIMVPNALQTRREPECPCPIKMIIETKSQCIVEHKHKDKDGENIIVEIRTFPLIFLSMVCPLYEGGNGSPFTCSQNIRLALGLSDGN
ncbi:hypothetical protein ACFLV4_06850 [Chloroflexota bacterium]